MLIKDYDTIFKEEATLLERVTKWLLPQERDGIKLIRVVDRYAKGYSDLFICVMGRFVVAELKDDTGTASPHQEEFIEDMIRAGASGGVCRSIKDVHMLIEDALYCSCEKQAIFSTYCPHCGKLVRRAITVKR